MALPRPLCARLPARLERELEAVFSRNGWGPSEGLRQIIEEWYCSQEFAGIEFRSTALGRRAAVVDGPEVWQVVQVAQERGAAAAVQHFNWIPNARVEAALAYYAQFPGSVDALIQRNERVAAELRREASA